MNYHKTAFIIFASVLCLQMTACYRIPDKPSLSSEKPQAPLPPIQIEPEKEIPKYIYQGVKFQDPFIQLEKGGAAIIQRDTASLGVDPAMLMFKGFIKQGTKSIALLTDSTGNTYFLKDMKLVDMKGRVIPGVIGIIKGESIHVETDDGVSRQIKLYE